MFNIRPADDNPSTNVSTNLSTDSTTNPITNALGIAQAQQASFQPNNNMPSFPLMSMPQVNPNGVPQFPMAFMPGMPGNIVTPFFTSGFQPASISEVSVNQENEVMTAADGTKFKVCRMYSCSDPAAKRTPYCKLHTGIRRCEFPSCAKCAQGRTRFCIGHGGGRRCTFPGCTKGARDKHFCAGHGGGRRCEVVGCSRSAVGGCTRCTGHGGGRRCQVEGCAKSAQSCTPYCVKHGGGKKCVITACSKVARGKTSMCMSHNGLKVRIERGQQMEYSDAVLQIRKILLEDAKKKVQEKAQEVEREPKHKAEGDEGENFGSSMEVDRINIQNHSYQR